MTELQIKLWDTLIELDSKTLLNILTNYYGLQILDKDLEEYLIREEIINPPFEPPYKIIIE